MKSQKKRLFVFALVMLAAIFVISGCTRPYTEDTAAAPQATPTIGGDGFPEALPEENMDDVFTAGLQTQTALAGGGAAAPAGSTPEPAPAGGDTPVATNTPVPVADQPTAAPATVTAAPPPTSVVGRPASYTLKAGEFPYCIARRFDVDPKALLDLNGLTYSQAETYYSGMTLQIPQSAGSFPAPRYLNNHPASYTLPKNMSVYGVACVYGDVDPADIVNANTIADVNNIPAGTVLNIP